MENGEKKDYEVSSDPPHYGHDVEAVDMRNRHGSVIVKNEAAEIYGDIQTAEREYRPQPYVARAAVADLTQNTATSLAVSSPGTSSSSPSAVQSARVCSWVSALPS